MAKYVWVSPDGKQRFEDPSDIFEDEFGVGECHVLPLFEDDTGVGLSIKDGDNNAFVSLSPEETTELAFVLLKRAAELENRIG